MRVRSARAAATASRGMTLSTSAQPSLVSASTPASTVGSVRVVGSLTAVITTPLGLPPWATGDAGSGVYTPVYTLCGDARQDQGSARSPHPPGRHPAGGGYGLRGARLRRHVDGRGRRRGRGHAPDCLPPLRVEG